MLDALLGRFRLIFEMDVCQLLWWRRHRLVPIDGTDEVCRLTLELHRMLPLLPDSLRFRRRNGPEQLEDVCQFDQFQQATAPPFSAPERMHVTQIFQSQCLTSCFNTLHNVRVFVAVAAKYLVARLC